jgi:hypothetical protein
MKTRFRKEIEHQAKMMMIKPKEHDERENSQRMQLYQKSYLNNLAKIRSEPREALTMMKSLKNMKKMKQGGEEYTNSKCQRDWRSG